MKLEARSEDGEMRSSFPGLDLREGKQGPMRLWTGAVGPALNPVTVETKFGDIAIEREES
jgi:hypothetical protein